MQEANAMTSNQPIVHCENIVRHYAQGTDFVRAVDGVTLDIFPGEFTALSGPSGSGKTTILNLIGALDEPTSGKVIVEGHDVTSMNRSEKSAFRRDRIGFVFQAYNLIPVLTAYENAEFILVLQKKPVEERRSRILQLMNEAGMKGMENRKPHQLSGGQQQRVAIIRAIAARPAIVLADEPTANVDSKTAGRLLDMMEQLNRRHGVTFLFSSHDQQVIHRARRIVHIHDGLIVRNEIKP